MSIFRARKGGKVGRKGEVGQGGPFACPRFVADQPPEKSVPASRPVKTVCFTLAREGAAGLASQSGGAERGRANVPRPDALQRFHVFFSSWCPACRDAFPLALPPSAQRAGPRISAWRQLGGTDSDAAEQTGTPAAPARRPAFSALVRRRGAAPAPRVSPRPHPASPVKCTSGAGTSGSESRRKRSSVAICRGQWCVVKLGGPPRTDRGARRVARCACVVG